MSAPYLNLQNLIICQYLPISDYTHLGQTCRDIYQFCTGSQEDSLYWKSIYQLCYSAIDENKSSCKDKIKHVELEIKKHKIFSKKFQVCVDLKCEKLGSLRVLIKKQIRAEVLTSCLRSLLRHKNISIDLAQIFAEKLLAAGANPMQNSNKFLNDSPLTIAVLSNQQNLRSLFLKHINKNEENIKQIAALITSVVSNNVKSNVSDLESFLKNDAL